MKALNGNGVNVKAKKEFKKYPVLRRARDSTSTVEKKMWEKHRLGEKGLTGSTIATNLALHFCRRDALQPASIALIAAWLCCAANPQVDRCWRDGWSGQMAARGANIAPSIGPSAAPDTEITSIGLIRYLKTSAFCPSR